MIELAPGNKRGLAIAGPLMLAAGGYGGELDRSLLAAIHALVTLPTSLRPRPPGIRTPRVEEFAGGALISTEEANLGLAAVLRDNRHIWRSTQVPIILALAGHDARHWGEAARRVGQLPPIAALQLEVIEELDPAEAVAAARAECDLALLARIPIEGALVRTEAALAAGADCIVVGLGPKGRSSGEAPWEGRLVGASVKPQALRAVRELAERFPEQPLVACGGIHSTGDVRAFLSAGAWAVQIDSAIWRNPLAIYDLIG